MRALRKAAVVGAGSIVALVALAAPVAAAPDYQLDASGMEQTVLRAQMPKSLGSWRQNIYFGFKSDAPAVCWGSNGKQLTLPKASLGGGVGYEVSQYITGSVMIFQYKDQKSADAALAALRATVCPDSPKVALDSGPSNIVQASAGSDWTSASKDSMVASITYPEGDVKVTTETITSVVGVSVVQTQVMVAGPEATSKGIQRASDMNESWHAKVVKAYEAFGSGSSG